MIKHKDYFEGILQLRNTNDEIIKYTVNQVEKREDIHISNFKKVKNGFDIYISSQRFLRNLCNKIQKRFGGNLVMSKKLHTKNRLTSKEVYRVNALLRFFDFKKGDIIDYKGDKIKITAIHKKVFAKNLVTGKKLNLRFKDLD